MINRRETAAGLLLAALLAVSVLAGCRAFEPEAVIVNKAPETYIIGAPLEDGGGYYRFHVRWYGSDADGTVEKFVWALTDTTVQDEDTTVDEENQRFNPALNASTLEIGRWTTKTDSVFNFKINQGVGSSYDMTLHMVAVDDYGDFDRTPARLHFFSNSLGNPDLNFFRISGTDTIPLDTTKPDTVGYGFPYTVYWSGMSPNIRGYSPEALAEVDTVQPYWDGLFGFKYQILGELGGNCLPSLQDCWQPRKFNEATSDSYSVFADSIRSLTFHNTGTSSTNPFEKLLPSGRVDVEVNSIDIAGVEVAEFRRPFSFLVNFDPETRLLNGESDPEHPEDPEIYPYYIQLNDPAQIHHPFQAGDRIPDRTYVVVKALGRDDPRDGRLRPDFQLGFVGSISGERQNFTGGTFSFKSESSDLNLAPTWGVPTGCDTCWYADTLGFLTGPRSEFTVLMQSEDEHRRRDGSPAELSFFVGHPPCVQCIELLNSSSIPSGYDQSLACIDDPTDLSHPCLADTAVFTISTGGTNPGDLEFVQNTSMWVQKSTGQVTVASADMGFTNHYRVDASTYRMTMLLHGKDDPREAWNDPVRRVMGWQYQVDYDCDPFNEVKDGGGNDDLREPTWGLRPNVTGLDIDPVTGLWSLDIEVTVPTQLTILSPALFKAVYLSNVLGITDPDTQDWVFERLVRQTGRGTVQAVALDQTSCGFSPPRPARYNLFGSVRPPLAQLPAGQTWRDCDSGLPDILLALPLQRGAMASQNAFDEEELKVTKHFRIILTTPTQGNYECSTP